jgi:hypothetical protein
MSFSMCSVPLACMHPGRFCLRCASLCTASSCLEDITKSMAAPATSSTGDQDGAAEGEVERTAVKRGNDEVTKLRRLCDNTAQVALMYYLDDTNRRRQLIIVEIGDVLARAHGHQNVAQRSVSGTLKFTLDSVQGRGLRTISQIIEVLWATLSLRGVSFCGMSSHVIETGFTH